MNADRKGSELRPGRLRRRALQVSLVLLPIPALVVACTTILGDDYIVVETNEAGGSSASGGASAGSGGTATGGGAANGGSGGSGGSGATGGAGGAGGTSPPFECIDVSTITPPCTAANQEKCMCVGCVNDGVCYDGQAQLVDDCICRDCVADTACGNYCDLDGQCNPFRELCDCADCADHWACYCQTCSERLADYEPAMTTCPGSEDLWDAMRSCMCSQCNAECDGFCNANQAPNATCNVCYKGQCANYEPPCLGD